MIAAIRAARAVAALVSPVVVNKRWRRSQLVVRAEDYLDNQDFASRDRWPVSHLPYKCQVSAPLILPNKNVVLAGTDLRGRNNLPSRIGIRVYPTFAVYAPTVRGFQAWQDRGYLQ